MGGLAAGMHGADELLHLNGAEIACSKDGNDFSVSGLSNGQKVSLYESRGAGIFIPQARRHRTYFDDDARVKAPTVYSSDENTLAKQLITEKGLTQEQANALAKQIHDEYLGLKQTCQDTPGRVFKTMSSDLKKLNNGGAGTAH